MLKSFEIQLACRNGDGLLTATELKAGQSYAGPVELHETTTMTKTKHATGILYHIFVCFLPGLEKGGLKDIPGDLQVVLTALSLGSCLLDWKLPSRILCQSICLRHQAVTFCQEILKAIDADGSGVIDYTEFLVS